MFLPAYFHQQCRNAKERNPHAPFSLQKEYPRFPRIALPAPVAPGATLGDALASRESSPKLTSNRDVSLGELSTLLRFGAGAHPRPHDPATHSSPQRRMHPSGGGCFPLELYIAASAVEGLESGLYHYHPASHSLERLPDFVENDSPMSFLRADARDAAFALVITSVWERQSRKYFDFAYPLAVLEAGHLSQNLLLLCAALKLPSCPMAGFDDDRLCAMLDINRLVESPLHSIVVGA